MLTFSVVVTFASGRVCVSVGCVAQRCVNGQFGDHDFVFERSPDRNRMFFLELRPPRIRFTPVELIERDDQGTIFVFEDFNA